MTIKQHLKEGIKKKLEKIKQDAVIIKKKGNLTSRLPGKFDILEKTQRKMEKSKNKLSKDLLKVLQKVEIDRP